MARKIHKFNTFFKGKFKSERLNWYVKIWQINIYSEKIAKQIEEYKIKYSEFKTPRKIIKLGKPILRRFWL